MEEEENPGEGKEEEEEGEEERRKGKEERKSLPCARCCTRQHKALNTDKNTDAGIWKLKCEKTHSPKY